jgi:hypothetical protein
LATKSPKSNNSLLLLTVADVKAFKYPQTDVLAPSGRERDSLSYSLHIHAGIDCTRGWGVII